MGAAQHTAASEHSDCEQPAVVYVDEDGNEIPPSHLREYEEIIQPATVQPPPPELIEQKQPLPLQEHNTTPRLEVFVPGLETVYEFPLDMEVAPNMKIGDITQALVKLEPIYLRRLANETAISLWDETSQVEIRPNETAAKVYEGLHTSTGRKKWNYRLVPVPVNFTARQQQQQQQQLVAYSQQQQQQQQARGLAGPAPNGSFASFGGTNAGLQLISNVPYNTDSAQVPEIMTMDQRADPQVEAMRRMQQEMALQQQMASGSSFALGPSDPRLQNELRNRPANSSHRDPMKAYMDAMSEFNKNMQEAEQKHSAMQTYPMGGNPQEQLYPSQPPSAANSSVAGMNTQQQHQQQQIFSAPYQQPQMQQPQQQVYQQQPPPQQQQQQQDPSAAATFGSGTSMGVGFTPGSALFGQKFHAGNNGSAMSSFNQTESLFGSKSASTQMMAGL